jgi:phosphoserine aminotransferase
MYNTPPTYAIYIAGLVFQWIKAQGGLPAMEAHNRQGRAAVRLPGRHGFYSSPVARGLPLADERALQAPTRRSTPPS